MSKKFDTTSKNLYPIIRSNSEWEMVEENPLSSKSIIFERVSSTPETLTIKKNSVDGVQYKMYDEDDLKFKDQDKTKTFQLPTLKVYLSKHISIPYAIYPSYGPGMRIEVNYLNQIDSQDL